MKKKRKRLFKPGAILLLPLVTMLFCIPGIEARAGCGELTATTDRIIKRPIYHHHSARCSEELNYFCSGEPEVFFSGYHDGVRMYRVECTKRESQIAVDEPGTVLLADMHEGFGQDMLTKEEADAFIAQHWRGGGHRLTLSGRHCGLQEGEVIGEAGIIHNKDGKTMDVYLSGERVAKVSASFDKGTLIRDSNYGLGGGEHIIEYSANGIYTGTYTYMDHVSGEQFTDTISYTINHLPITVKYSIDGSVRDELTTSMTYGGALPAKSRPVKTGYSFQGYYLDDVMYYDADCRAVNGADTRFLDMSVTFTAKWAPEVYKLEYAGKAFNVTYDSPYSGITPDPSRAPEGYELDRFCIGDTEPFNMDGSPKNSRWIWPVGTQGVHSVTEVWKARHFTLRYGDPASNGGTVPDIGSVEYDAAYPDISPSEWDRPRGYELEGIYIDDQKLYSEKGEALRTKWKWVPDSGDDIELINKWKAKVYRIYHGPNGAGGKPAWSADAEYGSPYPGVKIYTADTRTGYKIDGLYIEDEKIYDGEGNPALDVWDWEFEERELYPEVRWMPKTATVVLPDDGGEITVTYDASYPKAEEPKPRQGMVFEGYYLGDEQVYDAECKPESRWKWDIPDGGRVELKARWTPKKYSIYFGPDNDGDGIGDIFISVTYGEPYTDITPPVFADGEVFDGFYSNGEMVFDSKGAANGVWRWDPEEYPLETRSHMLPPPEKEAEPEPDDTDSEEDRNGDPDKDRTPDKDGDPDKDKTPDKDSDPDKDNTPDKDSDPDKDNTPDKAPDPDKDADPDKDKVPEPDKDRTDEPGIPDSEEEESDDSSEDDTEKKDKKKQKKKTDRNSDGQNDADNDGDGINGGPNDGSRDSDDTSADNNGDPVSKNSVLPDPEGDDKDHSNTVKRRKNTSEKDISSDMETFKNEMSEYMLNTENGDDKGIVSTVYSELMNGKPDINALKKQMEERAERNAVPEADAKAAAKAAWKEKAVKVAKAGAVTAGSAAGIAAVYAGLVYLFGMAEIYSICPDGRKKRLGKLAINEEGNGFMVNISRNLLNECETDKLGMRLSAFFVSRNKNREMIINNDGRKQQEYIRRDIIVAV